MDIYIYIYIYIYMRFVSSQHEEVPDLVIEMPLNLAM